MNLPGPGPAPGGAGLGDRVGKLAPERADAEREPGKPVVGVARPTAAVTPVRQPVRSTASLSMSISGTGAYRVRTWYDDLVAQTRRPRLPCKVACNSRSAAAI
jgi:hypothetical protein